jgi:hypothetical protein
MPIKTGMVIEVLDGRSGTVAIIVVQVSAVAVNCVLARQQAVNLRGQELGGREVSIGDGLGVLVVVSVDWWCLVGQSTLRHGNLDFGLGVEGIEELHNNIMFYLAIILFTVT